MSSSDNQKTKPVSGAPDSTRRRLIKGGATLPFVATLASSANLAAESACDASGTCGASIAVNENVRNGSPKFGSYV